MRDLLVLLVVGATIPLAFYRPFYGLLGFSWLAYMRPQDLAWGLAASFPLSKFVALAIWVSLILRGKINVFRISKVTVTLALLWMWLAVAVLTAGNRDLALAKWTDISKVILVAFLTVVLVTDRKRFQWSVAVIGLSLGALGLKFGVFGILRGGVHFTRGVGGMIGDNNDFALALNMSIPLLLYLGSTLQHRWLRWGARLLVPVTALTVIFTQSRGGFLTLGVMTLFLILRSRRPVLALATIATLAAAAAPIIPESFYDRMQTIVHYEDDGSAMGRLNAWQAAYHMANDYPIFGVGLDNFMEEFAYYAPDPENVKVAHNTYLQLLAETGYTGLLLYLAVVVAAFVSLDNVRRWSKRYRIGWAGEASKYLSASLLAFLVGGTFLSRAHFDLTYHVMILGCCLERIVRVEVQHLRWVAVQAASRDDVEGVSHERVARVPATAS